MTPRHENAWGTTIFCEDIRSEIGGKATFVGVYANSMNVHVPFPHQVPKFGFWIKYFEVPGTMSGDGKLMIYLPGEDGPAIEADIPLAEIRATSPKVAVDLPDDEDIGHVWQFQMPLMVAPLVLKEPGRIKVRMLVNDKIVRIGALPVLARPRGATAPTASEPPASQSPPAAPQS